MAGATVGTEPAPPAWSQRVEAGLLRLTDAISMLWAVLVGVIVLAVILRYAFGIGRIELEELQWHLHAVGFLMGIVACAATDRHVRVDVLRERMRPRTRAWVDLYGSLLLLGPFLALVLWSALPFVAESFAVGERSDAPGGLPLRWALKAVLPLSFLLLMLATSARVVRVWQQLFGEDAGSGAR
jgi:TRAP-type mannitol/chloroaromatic compound transport system permease small subunit